MSEASSLKVRQNYCIIPRLREWRNMVNAVWLRSGKR